MKCSACGLENPPSASRCDCGRPMAARVQMVEVASAPASPESKGAIRFVWLAPLIGAVLATAELAANWDSQKVRHNKRHSLDSHLRWRSFRTALRARCQVWLESEEETVTQSTRVLISLVGGAPVA
jgi:hypothetical protein